MRVTAIVLCLGMAAMLAGCVPDDLAWPGSLYPMYSSEQEVITDPALLGEWRDVLRGDTSDQSQLVKWFFREDERPGTYLVGRVSGNDSTRWRARLVKSGDVVFLDALAVDEEVSENDNTFSRRLALHQFVRVEKSGEQVRLSSLDGDWYLRQLESKQFPLKVERLGDNVPVITSAPAEVRAFYTKAATQPGAFGEIAVLARPAAKQAQ